MIKGWLPPAAVKKIKFLTKSNMTEYVAEDQMLEDWGGTDDWQYAWLSESSEGKNQQPHSTHLSSGNRSIQQQQRHHSRQLTKSLFGDNL